MVRGSQRPASAFSKDTDDDQGTVDHPRQVGLLELARQLGNVSQACRLMGYLRARFLSLRGLHERRRRISAARAARRKAILPEPHAARG